ncbi:MAG: hypothetical protein ACI9FR_000196 [Cryomorphaceae bacterium]|jgi:hypothetical protein
MLKIISSIIAVGFMTISAGTAMAARVAYIHGDVSETGFTPAASATSGSPFSYDQMLLNDTGRTGLSMFQNMVESSGHTISQHYDQQTQLNSAWLSNKDLMIFGLHQKILCAAEKAACATG